uniref:Uncharacterized protein n=2 Tax=unclassified Caudoviricetes TaxID=2788787 RepID=A0A8S5NBL4_9CAUD|nr:MAG TPA: hypothetical protein [Siphoviridae sp. ctCOj19]DAD91650.1 MAG TPA: hypothetical protein [Siphoviridae sp. ctjd446]
MFLFWFNSVGRLVCEDWPPLFCRIIRELC